MSALINMPTDLMAQCAALLADAHIEASIQSVVPCDVGGNNRTYRIQTSIGPVALKQYYRHEGDTRDRLATEFAFLDYAAKVAPGMAPTPLAMNEPNGLALYEFIEGSRYKPGNLTWEQVGRATQFFRALNDSAARKEATALPTASEACFSITEHLDLIASRLGRLQTFEAVDGEDRAAQVIIKKIYARWLMLAEEVAKASQLIGLDPNAPLEQAQRCLSPSDFGFHTALVQLDGKLCFLDFEYAGWDDPAKMISDFFSQLAVPVPANLFDRFVQEVVMPFPRPEEIVQRARLLLPLYQVKWCCIALNIFLPANLARRKFANPALDEKALKQSQLAKATNLFQSTQVLSHGLH